MPGSSALPQKGRVGNAMHAIAGFIARSGFAPGERLPTERKLMEELAVGRSTVREVLRKLETLGIIQSRKGSGTYLLRPISGDSIAMPLVLDAPCLRDRLLQTLEVRRGLEAEAAALAALRATPDDIAIIDARLEHMEAVHHQKGGAGEEDLAFHLAIYHASHNPLFGQLLEQMRDAFESFFEKPFDRPDFARRSFALHRELFDAIVRHDPDAARQKTLAILAIVEEDIKEMSR